MKLLMEKWKRTLKEFDVKGLGDSYEPGTPQDILGTLEKILVSWEKMDDLSDEERWQRYSKDIQRVVSLYRPDEGPYRDQHTKEVVDPPEDIPFEE